MGLRMNSKDKEIKEKTYIMREDWNKLAKLIIKIYKKIKIEIK